MSAVSRLHVTPFDSLTLPALLPAAVRDQASDVTFHTVSTFPEASYGFLTLPAAEATRLKNKFHGCTFKGRKMRVENARPKRTGQRASIAEEDEQRSTPAQKTRSRASGSSREDTLAGLELPSGRKVERGWTGNKDEQQPKSTGLRESRQSFSNSSTVTEIDPRCLFKTKHTASEPQRKRKRTKEQRTKIVPEFKHTVVIETSESSKAADQPTGRYVDGEGWLNEAGDLVETAKSRGLASDVAPDVSSVASPEVSGMPSGDIPNAKTTNADQDSGSDDDKSAKASSRATGRNAKARRTLHRPVERERASSVDEELSTAEVERLSISRSSGSPVPHATTSQPTSAPSSQVHPLEAFFKRPQAAASHSHTPRKPHLEVSTSFSFFGPDQDMPSTEDASTLLPQTPFTQQDFRHRRQRSAAPTPDTALPGKTFGDSLGQGDHQGSSDDSTSSGDSAVAGANATDTVPPVENVDGRHSKEKSEGAKWFYEHRGETNRAWKRRKREATKERKLRDRRARR